MDNTKLLTVSLIGPPNAGKSTLTNLIVGEKISSMSPKAHTTRVQVRGVLTKKDTQLIFVDTPGFTHNNNELDIETDCVCLVLDATHPWQYNNKTKIKTLLQVPDLIFSIIVNKGDLISKQRWVELIQELVELGYNDVVWFTSALLNKGVDKFVDFLCEKAIPGPWWFEEEVKHELTKKDIILECVREKIFHLTHKEVPYSIELELKELETKSNRPWKAKVVLKTERTGQKNILIGKKASVIKAIGESARLELCSKWGPGSLFLEVV